MATGRAGLIPVALLDAAVQTAVAFAFEVPAAHVLAGACLTLAYLFGWHVVAGTLGWTGATTAAGKSICHATSKLKFRPRAA